MIEMFGRIHSQGKGNRIWPSASSLFSPAGRRWPERADEGGRRPPHPGSGSAEAPLIASHPLGTSPRWGEEGDRCPATSFHISRSPFTSPLRGEVARHARVGVIATSSAFAAVTPPRTYGPALPLKERVTT